MGRFGMIVDNFKVVKDPNIGSYSISFQNYFVYRKVIASMMFETFLTLFANIWLGLGFINFHLLG